MTTTPLSNANSGYLNSILNNTYKAPAPQITSDTTQQTKKENNGTFSKALLCLAAIGALGIQAIGLSKKPASVDSSQDIKAINKLVEDLKQEVSALSKKINTTTKDATASSSDDILKAITAIQEGIDKAGKENTEIKTSLEILNQIKDSLSKLSQIPQEQGNVDLSQVGTLMDNFVKQITALAEQTGQKTASLGQQIAKSQEEVQKITQKAKQEIVDATNKASKAMAQDGSKMQGEISQMSKQIEGLGAKVENSSANAKKIDSLEKLCKQITQAQTQQDKVTQSQFEELIDAFNMFIGVKKLPVDMIEFKGDGNKIPFIKGTNEIFTGVLTKELNDGSFYEISYVDGQLIQSKKFDSTGKKLLQKRYNRVLTQLKPDTFKQETSVTITDGTPIATKTVFEHVRNSQGENLTSKVCKKVINEDDKTARDNYFLFKNDKLTRTFELDGDKKIEKIYTPQSGTTPVRTREDSFKIVELEADVKDPYKYFAFQPNK